MGKTYKDKKYYDKIRKPVAKGSRPIKHDKSKQKDRQQKHPIDYNDDDLWN